MDFKNNTGNSNWNVFKNCQWKFDALNLFSATTIHKMDFIFERVQSLYYFYNLEEFQSMSKMFSDFSYNLKKKLKINNTLKGLQQTVYAFSLSSM